MPTLTEDEVIAKAFLNLAGLKPNSHKKGWEWWEIPAGPAQLTRLVTAGKLKIVGKKNGRNIYRLASG